MSDKSRSSHQNSRPNVRSLKSKALLGTALAAVLGGALFGNSLVMSEQPAYAAAVPTTPTAASQLPSFADVVERVSPAVVSIRVQESDDSPAVSQNIPDLPEGSPLERFFRDFRGQMPNPGDDEDQPHGPHGAIGLGSGFFISADGYVVTNNHVVQGGTSFTVIAQDGTEYDAHLIGTDDKTDLALLKIDGHDDFTYVQFAANDIRVGDWVVAVGNPFGLGGTVTAGIVSGQGRQIGSGPYDDFIQIDAAVNRGNSGGPTFNLNGEVVGVNTAIYSPSGGNVGIAFAIPAATVQNVVDQLRDHGAVVRGWLGVQIQPVNADIAASLNLQGTQGALVAQPQEDSPALAAGIEPGDTILAVNGQDVAGPRELARMIANMAPGTEVTVTLWRDGASQDVQVTLGTLPGQQQLASAQPNGGDAQVQPSALEEFGLSLEPADDGHGVVITEVKPDSEAAARGFQPGDVILSVSNEAVAAPADVEAQIAAAREEGLRAVLFRLQSENQPPRYIALPFDAA